MHGAVLIELLYIESVSLHGRFPPISETLLCVLHIIHLAVDTDLPFLVSFHQVCSAWLVLPPPGRDAVSEEAINLLHGPSRDLTNTEVHVRPCDEAQTGVDKPCLRAEVR